MKKNIFHIGFILFIKHLAQFLSTCKILSQANKKNETLKKKDFYTRFVYILSVFLLKNHLLSNLKPRSFIKDHPVL
jgi:hypothetical protein